MKKIVYCFVLMLSCFNCIAADSADRPLKDRSAPRDAENARQVVASMFRNKRMPLPPDIRGGKIVLIRNDKGKTSGRPGAAPPAGEDPDPADLEFSKIEDAVDRL